MVRIKSQGITINNEDPDFIELAEILYEDFKNEHRLNKIPVRKYIEKVHFSLLEDEVPHRVSDF